MSKQKLIDTIRAVPISGRTYEEYVEAVADRLLAEGDMSNKQIAEERYEISEIISNSFDHNGEKWDASDFEWSAHCVQVAGYRKSEEVAREIFEEIEKRLAMYSHLHRYAEEAKEVTEEYADGSPVEMTSVWDACRLEHNGYDDYETMCKLQDNIGNIEKSRLLKEFEGDIAQLKKKYTEEWK